MSEGTGRKRNTENDDILPGLGTSTCQLKPRASRVSVESSICYLVSVSWTKSVMRGLPGIARPNRGPDAFTGAVFIRSISEINLSCNLEPYIEGSHSEQNTPQRTPIFRVPLKHMVHRLKPCTECQKVAGLARRQLAWFSISSLNRHVLSSRLRNLK